jgi:peptide/nickel transport system permease protein
MSPLARLFSQHRIKVSRVFGIAFVAILLTTGSIWQGTLTGRVLFLVGIATSQTYLSIFAFVVLLQFSSNFAQGPFQGYVPDLVPANQVGLASALVGVMSILGVIGGTLLVSTGYALGSFLVPTIALGLVELATAAEDYVQGARALGARDLRLMFRHILPNIFSSLLVQATVSIPIAIIAEAVLSFLGLGVQPPAPSWGTMLNAAQQFLDSAPWMAWWPGLAIFALALSFNLAGDGLRDLLDPRDY